MMRGGAGGRQSAGLVGQFDARVKQVTPEQAPFHGYCADIARRKMLQSMIGPMRVRVDYELAEK
jgi:hypothetical protein